MKRAVRVVQVLLGVYAVLLVTLTLAQRSILYHPRRDGVGPAAAGLARARVLTLETADRERLVAWYIAARPGKPLLLYFQGNGGGLAERAKRFEVLTADGNGLLAVSYRGYFGSSGTPTESGLNLDAEAGYAEALALGYRPERIVAVGESLGSGVAVALAARRRLAAIVLDSPYSSILDVAAARYWIFPVRYLLWDRFPSDELIGKVHVPALFTCGEEDGVVPIRFCNRLFALANEPKDIVRVPDAGHLVLGLPGIAGQALNWLDRHVPQATP